MVKCIITQKEQEKSHYKNLIEGKKSLLAAIKP